MLNLKAIFLAILLLLNSGLAFAQSSTLSALPAITSPADTDLMYVVKIGDASPDRKITISDLRDALGGGVSFDTCAELAAAVSDETGTGACVFANSPTFVGQLTTPKVVWSGGQFDFSGAGSPEGVVTATVGSTYRNTTGGAGTTFYSKESGSGNTGWVAYGSPAGSGAPTTAGYWVKTADGTLSDEFVMGSLATGLVKNTTTTGVPTIAVACTDYLDTSCVLTNANLPTTITSRTINNTNTVSLLDSLFRLQDNGDATKQMAFDLAAYTTGTTFTLTPPAANTHLIGGSHFSGTANGGLERTGTGTYAVIKHNRAATANPTVTDDTTAGYAVGSEWINVTLDTVWKAADVTASAAVWVQSGVAATPALQAISDVGRSITNASTFATGVHIGLSSTSGWRIYDSVSLGPILTCVVAGVENDCDWSRTLASGKYWDIKNSGGTAIFTLTESTGAVTNMTYNAESTGNVFTMPFEDWHEAAACNNATAALIFNSPTANAPAATCEGTNTRHATADFDDTTDEFFDFSWRLPTGFTGNIDIIFRWKGAATSGAVGWCAQIIRVALSAVSDPALPAQAAGNCVSSTADGTTLEETEATISGVTCTSCVAGDRVNIRISRDANGGAVTDSFVGDAKLIGFAKRYRRAM